MADGNGLQALTDASGAFELTVGYGSTPRCSNALNRTHYRYSAASVDLRTGRVFLERDTLFPFLPAVGVTLEF